MRTERLHPYDLAPACPKCGSTAIGLPIYHTGRRTWFLHAQTLGIVKRCFIGALDHFHYICHSCGIWHARACLDVKQQLEVS